MRRLVVCSALMVAFALASSAVAAAPRYIVVSGPCLREPALLMDWSENHAFLLALLEAPPASGGTRALGQRPRYGIALFWGTPAKRPPTRPADANQRGWFYPAHRRRPAVVDVLFDGVPRRAPTRALAILAPWGADAFGRMSRRFRGYCAARPPRAG